MLVARREDRLERLARELMTAHGITCETVAFDLSIDRAGAALREQVVGQFDLVVNNAGFATQGPFLTGNGEEFARVVAVDVRAWWISAMRVCRQWSSGDREQSSTSPVPPHFSPSPRLPSTRTEFFEVIGEGAAVAGRMQTAEQVAATGMRALDRRSTPPYVVSGIANSWTARLAALIPRRLLIPFVARILQPMHPVSSP